MDRSKIIIKKPKDNRSNIFILGIVSLLNDFSSEMIMPKEIIAASATTTS